MNRLLKITTIVIMVAFLAPALNAQENRDIWPLSTFVQSAKITYKHEYKKTKLRADMYKCIDLVRDASVRYPHVPEVYFMLGTFFAEINALDTMVAYFDSVEISCADESVDKKYRKKCEGDYLKKIEDFRQEYWEDAYNNAVKYLSNYDTVSSWYAKTAGEDSIKILDSLKQLAFDLSRGDFEQAIMLKPKDSRAVDGIGILLEREGKHSEAVGYYKRAMALTGEDCNGISRIAYAYIQNDPIDWDTVIVWFEKFIEKCDSTDISALTNLAIAAGQLNDIARSNSFNLKIIAVEPNNTQALFNIGQYWWIRMRDYNDSLSNFPDSISANKPIRQKFDNSIHQCRDTALYYYNRTLEVDPDDVDALNKFGIVHLLSGKEEGIRLAIEAFSHSVEINPNDKDALDYLGRAYIQSGDFKLAIMPYEKFVEIDPGDADIWEKLAELYEFNSQPEKAKEAKAKAEELKKL